MGKEDELVEERKKKIAKYLKEHPNVWIYGILILLVIFSFWIRTLNVSGLKDVTTSDWTLGPDLDPFLFLRWAEYIADHGSIMHIDYMRYVPLGYDTEGEMVFLSYLIAWFYKITYALGMTTSVTHAAIYFPVFMFMLTVVAFFLLARRVGRESLGDTNSGIMALIASFFLIVIPSLLPRTIAGIPEKESAGFFFMFLAFYFFLEGWKSNGWKRHIIWGVLAGLSTAGMALVWGGYVYIVVVVSLVLFISYFLGKLNTDKLVLSISWMGVAYAIMNLFSLRYSWAGLLTSTGTLLPIGVILLCAINLYFGEKIDSAIKKKGFVERWPQEVVVFASLLILVCIFALVFIGPEYLSDKAKDITKPLITPITSRFGVTVAENRQPYFAEWANEFGPIVKGIPLYFWMFMVGALYLYYHMTREFRKNEKILMSTGFGFFLFAMTFSRYSPSSIFDGTNFISLAFYVLGAIVFIGSFGYIYFRDFKKEKEKFENIDVSLILLFALFFFSVISARGGVRTIMVLVPSVAIIVPYMAVDLWSKIKSEKKNFQLGAGILLVIMLIYSAYGFYEATKMNSASFVPNEYTRQWQKAMEWVRENTPENAVFGHWWDYGYWLQSIGKRATVLDGGNAIGYWNHLMGRYALTGTDSLEALRFLYSHNTTHFLIDSTDIGKYGAFSSIGSGIKNDRLSYIPTLGKDYSQSKETKNGTLYFFSGGFGLDEDLVYEQDGNKIFLPYEKSGVAGVLIEIDKENKISKQPIAIYVSQSKQYQLPLRYSFQDKVMDYGNGVEAGVFIYPRIISGQQGAQIDPSGAALFLSNRTWHSQLARLYLFQERDPYFVKVYDEDDFLVKQIKTEGHTNSNFLLYGQFRGPISIWKINYPSWIELNETYIQISYPDKRLDKPL